jgi:uncharacterized membrane protein YdjX (TVP38/TMEM64 family)
MDDEDIRMEDARAIRTEHRLKDLTIIIAIILLIGLVFYFLSVFLSNAQVVREFIQSFGAFGPAVIIFLIMLEVIFAPIPGAFIAIGSGYAFGPFWGTLYSYIGNVIGTVIAFFLARRFGRPLAKRLIKDEKLEYYDRFFKERGVYGLWLAYSLPIFPTDILSFVTGFSNVRFRTFFLIISIAFIPNLLILNYLGDSILNYRFGLVLIIVGGLVGMALLVGGLAFLKKKTH